MSDYLRCHLCGENGATFAEAADVRKVPSHVRCFADDNFTVWRCSRCGSLHSKEAVDLNKYYADYPFKYHRLDYHTRIAYRNRLRMMKSLGIRADSTILDFGCGQGLYIDFLRTRGYNSVSGFDSFIPRYSDEKVLHKQYDFVISHDVIEHVEDPLAFFDLLVSLVAPGGTLVIGTPNASEIDLQDTTGPAVELSQPYHRHILSEALLATLANRHDLDVIPISHRFYYDSLIPTANVRFMWTYIQKKGGMIDVAVQPPDWKFILRSPELIFWAFFGYFRRVPGNILIGYRRRVKHSGQVSTDGGGESRDASLRM